MKKSIKIAGMLAVVGAFLAFVTPSFAQTGMETQTESTDQMQAPAADQTAPTVKSHKAKHHKKVVSAEKMKHKNKHHKMTDTSSTTGQ